MSDLTFAEAMALEPSAVEVLGEVHGWQRLSNDLSHWTLDYLRCAKFRRAKPKRSRVQEMAEAEPGRPAEGMRLMLREQAMTEAIRAVSEYIGKWFSEGWLDRGHHLRSDIEREFLEPG